MKDRPNVVEAQTNEAISDINGGDCFVSPIGLPRNDMLRILSLKENKQGGSIFALLKLFQIFEQ